ncbi:hypothetical protein PHLCEN_2v11629 [Hermanssonia centrifuga]|uniref:Uncharacterized protein n=1 Tax=Hermanssonia centrifuga TaxID=98765 RepID=A0A2R6NJK4_9APHY|nr:hypothetical protein PHLCEN_2v11629 [Hermanssonia centrifuga]
MEKSRGRRGASQRRFDSRATPQRRLLNDLSHVAHRLGQTWTQTANNQSQFDDSHQQLDGLPGSTWKYLVQVIQGSRLLPGAMHVPLDQERYLAPENGIGADDLSTSTDNTVIGNGVLIRIIEGPRKWFKFAVDEGGQCLTISA